MRSHRIGGNRKRTDFRRTERISGNRKRKLYRRTDKKSLETVFSIAICRQSGDKWQSKTKLCF